MSWRVHRLGKGTAQQGAWEGHRRKAAVAPAASLYPVLSSHSSAGRGPHGGSTRALITVLGRPFIEGAGWLWRLLQQCWPR